jgi:hypothetical protein
MSQWVVSMVRLLINSESQRIGKKAAVTLSRYYIGMWLEGRQKLQEPVEIVQTGNLPDKQTEATRTCRDSPNREPPRQADRSYKNLSGQSKPGTSQTDRQSFRVPEPPNV